MTMVSAGEIAAHSFDLTCPGCRRPLEISDFSRNLASFGALAVAALVWAFAASRLSGDESALGWIMPLLYAYFALSIAAPLLLIFLADLRLSSEPTAPVPHEAPAHHSTH